MNLTDRERALASALASVLKLLESGDQADRTANQTVARLEDVLTRCDAMLAELAILKEERK